MTRLKLIKKLTSDWFDSHKFVNQVYWGDFIRWYADKQIQHSSVVITPIRVTEVTRSKRAIQLQITYADRVYSDFRNLDEVHSDADRTLADFILSASNDKELRKFLTGLTSGNIEYFTNRTGDLIAGATMSVSLNVFSDANSCEIPVDFAPQPTPFECLDANYIVQYDNGTLIEQGTIPSGGSVTVEVPNPITCQDANYTLTDSFGNVLDSGTIASGGSATITAPDATFTISNTLGDLIDTGSILSGGNENVIAPDGTNNINKSNGVLIQSVSIPSDATIATDIADSVITLNNTEATTLSTTNVLATDTATITAPDATVNVNKSDGTLIQAVTVASGGVEPYNVADSVITVNSDAYTDLKATDSLNVPVVDSNGDAVATTVVAGEVQVDALPCAAPTDEWIRPADWLDMPVLTSTDDEIALLHAVWDNDSNYAALRCATTTGDYQVNWGDGTTTTHVSNTNAEHQYDYSTYDTGGATLSSRGYKQAMIRITPLTGGLATLNTNFRHSTQSQIYATGYLDVLLSMPNASAGISIFFRSQFVANRYMEQVEILNSGGLTSALYMFFGCSSLQSVPLFDTSIVTSMYLMFTNCNSLQSVPLFDTSSVTTMQEMFQNCNSLQSVPLFNTSSVENMQEMFQNCNSLQSVPLFNTSSVETMQQMFNGCTSLQSVPLFDTSSVTNMRFMFQDCSSLQSVPLFDTSSVTTMQLMFNRCIDLQSLPLFNTVNVTNMNRMVRECKALQEIPTFNTINVTNIDLFAFLCQSMSKTDIICRTSVSFFICQLSRDGIVNIFNNLIDLTGLTSQNINLQGNYGVASLSTADLEIATDKNWTVTT